MKTIYTYIIENTESDNKLNPNVDNEILEILNNISSLTIKSLKPYTDEYDPKRFEVQEENEKTIIDSLGKTQYNILTTAEFYNITHDDTFDYLTKKEKSEFDRNNGDIIFTDKNNKPIYCIDLKLSNRYIGAVNFGSLSYFKGIAEKQHIYICANIKTGEKCIFNHDVLYNAVDNDLIKLNNPRKDKKGYIVNDESLGTNYSECFVKGIDIRKIFSK